MKVILLKELKGRGGEGDVIDVARGFANNYLLTQGYAVRATKGNLKQLEQRRNNIAKREQVRLEHAKDVAEKLEDASVRIKVKVGEEGQLFGSVTSTMIAEAIASGYDVDIDKRRVDLNRPIKAVGEYQVPVSLYRDIKAVVNVVVGEKITKKSDEAEQGGQDAEQADEAGQAEAAEYAPDAIGSSAEDAGESAQDAVAETAADAIDASEDGTRKEGAKASAETVDMKAADEAEVVQTGESPAEGSADPADAASAESGE